MSRSHQGYRRPAEWAGERDVTPFLEFHGTPGRDRITGTDAADSFDVSQGGNDVIRCRAGNDAVYFGAAFTGADRVNGRGGVDVVTLDGDYSAGVQVEAKSLYLIEKLVLEGGPYVITGHLNFKNSLGETFVDATSLSAGQGLHLSVASVGALQVAGGAGDDVLDASGQTSRDISRLNGAAGDDVLIGGTGSYELSSGLGADRLSSNSDETRFVYTDTRESARKEIDTIERFQGKLWFLFDSDTTTAARDHDFTFEKSADRTGNILMRYDAGRDETIVKVFTDPDHKADFVLHLTGDVPLTPADFLFG